MKTFLRRTKASIACRLYNLFKNERFFWLKTTALYEMNCGCALKYPPRLITEKLMWLTRYWQHPLKTQCADKYLVREYVEEKGLKHLLTPLIAVFDSAEEIDFSVLPQRFVLKCNHGSGYNIIVKNKDEEDECAVKNSFAEWLKRDYSELLGEVQYHLIPRKIVCEELLSAQAPMEYQFWCVNGEPDSMLVCRKNNDGTYDAYSCSCAFEQLFERIGETKMPDDLQKPAKLNEMIEYARILSKDFPFVRVDFYYVNGRVYFAELTFTPGSNYFSSYPDSFKVRLGDKLVLPEAIDPLPFKQKVQSK